MKKRAILRLIGALALSAALLVNPAAAAGLRLVTGQSAATSQSVGFSGLSADCQSLQATFTLSAGSQFNFTVDSALAAKPGVYVTAKQSGGTVTIYATAKAGALTDTGALTLGTLSAGDGSTAFTVQKATGLKLIGADSAETTYETVTDGSASGGSSSSGSSKPDTKPDPTPETPETPDAAPEGLPFADVPAGSWYYDSVAYVYENGMMAGTGSSQFSPNMTTSRAMIVTILYRLEGSPAAAQPSAFTDVAAGQWYTDGVAWANANGIVTGYDNGKFGPNDTITREQMAAILYRYAAFKGYDVSGRADLSGFADAGRVAAYAADSVRWAVKSGLISGVTPTTLEPGGSATRAQAAAILTRFCKSLAV